MLAKYTCFTINNFAGIGGDGMKFLHGRVGMEWKFCGEGGETGRERAGMEITSAETDGDGCNFVPMQICRIC